MGHNKSFNITNQSFNFSSGTKLFTYGLMGVGLLSLILTFIFDKTDHHTEFWAVFLQNTVLFTGVGFLALLIYCAKVTMYSGWHVQFNRVFEAMSQFLFVGFVLLLFLLGGIYLDVHHLYHWSIPGIADHDELIRHKKGFLNKEAMAFATVLFVGMWCYFAHKIRSVSVEEDSLEFGANFKKMKTWAAVFLPVGGFSSAAIFWYWIMSIDPHWYSTLFAWYCTASFLATMTAILILILIFLKSRGYYEYVTSDHLHDLGKYLFAFSIFWTYLWFSQFLLIWYANIGEETVYFDTRLQYFKPIFFINLALNFAAPFLILMRNSTKRKVGTLTFAASLVLLGHWVDFFQIVRPGLFNEARLHAVEAGHTADFFSTWSGFTFPSLLDLGSFLFFAGLFLYVVFSYLSSSSLLPKNNAYLDESLNHHVV